MDFILDSHCQFILEEYRSLSPVFGRIQSIVQEQLEACVKECDMNLYAVESRIKSEDSLKGKLELKGSKYKTLSDITDIVGARIITIYSDEVDKIATPVEKKFQIDWGNSIDKRKVLEIDRFGYMSLHYVCRIPETMYHDPGCPAINEYRVEIQIRTSLQHVWATMNHDIGYKSDIEVPREYLRNLNRIAGMLELADEQFSQIRREIAGYRRSMQYLVSNGNFDEVPLNGDTFRSYLLLHPFESLVEKIASINRAEIYQDSLEQFLDVLLKMNFKTLGDIDRLIKDHSESAYKLALHQFAGTDLDIVAYSVALQNLCLVYIAKKGGGEVGLNFFYDAVMGESSYNVERAKRILNQMAEINII